MLFSDRKAKQYFVNLVASALQMAVLYSGGKCEGNCMSPNDPLDPSTNVASHKKTGIGLHVTHKSGTSYGRISSVEMADVLYTFYKQAFAC